MYETLNAGMRPPWLNLKALNVPITLTIQPYNGQLTV